MNGIGRCSGFFSLFGLRKEKTIQFRKESVRSFSVSGERLLSSVEGGLFGILSLYVNLITLSVGIRKPLVTVVTFGSVYLDLCYIWPFHYLLGRGFYSELWLSHLRGQRLLSSSVRLNSPSDTAHVCRH